MRVKSLREPFRGGRYKEWQAGYLRIAEITSVKPKEQKVDLQFIDSPGLRKDVKLTFPYASTNSAAIGYMPQVRDLAITGTGRNGRIFILGYIPKWTQGMGDVEEIGTAYPWYTLSPGEVFLRGAKGQFIWWETYGEMLSRLVLGDIKANRFQIEQDNRKIYGTTGLFYLDIAGSIFELGEAREIQPEGLDIPYHLDNAGEPIEDIENTIKGWNRFKVFIPEYHYQQAEKETEETWQRDNPILKIEGGTVIEDGVAVKNEDDEELCLRIILKKGGEVTEQGIKLEIDKAGRLDIFGQEGIHLKFDKEGNVSLIAKKINIEGTIVNVKGGAVNLGAEGGNKVARLGDKVITTSAWDGSNEEGTIEEGSATVKSA